MITMVRPSTVVQDQKILTLWGKGVPPKTIARRLGLPGTWSVKNTLRRVRRAKSNYTNLHRFILSPQPAR